MRQKQCLALMFVTGWSVLPDGFKALDKECYSLRSCSFFCLVPSAFHCKIIKSVVIVDTQAVVLLCFPLLRFTEPTVTEVDPLEEAGLASPLSDYLSQGQHNVKISEWPKRLHVSSCPHNFQGALVIIALPSLRWMTAEIHN